MPSISVDIPSLHNAYRTGHRDGGYEAMHIAFEVFQAILDHNDTRDGITRGYDAAKALWMEEQSRRAAARAAGEEDQFVTDLRESLEAAERSSFPEGHDD